MCNENAQIHKYFYMTHRCVDYASSMCSNGVGYVLNCHSIEMLVFAGSLNKKLLIKVVEVMLNEYVDITHNFQNIYTLWSKIC